MPNDLRLFVTAKTLGQFRAQSVEARFALQRELEAFVRRELETMKTNLIVASPRGPEPLDDAAQHVHMRDAWDVRMTSARSGYVTNPTPQATFQVTGTRAHIIEARHAATLRFVGRGGGLVFARRVHHPGTAQNAAFVQAMRAETTRVRADFARLGLRLAATYARATRVAGD